MKEESQLNIKLPDKPFLRPDEVAKILQLHIKTIYKMIDEKELIALRIRKKLLVPTNILYDYLKSSYQKSLPPSI